MQITVAYPKSVADRLISLKMFKEKMVQVGRSKHSKKYAYEGYKKVLRQVNDPKLMSLRRRLLLAGIAGDVTVEWKIANQIKSYLREPLLVDPNWQK